ncbi:uncharacterized protein si:ch211-243a20.4 [Myxocyprinus asiaticus]|uniref:uncharacterized protein si:ch211-243a20.4 n=1 Tax=Myxocyprinus asiaticus TaxID=70543 RepID=UPI002222D305|nr:uncharacterized protein si:ch211-243a20.4 [Myxocyprinus asiaticus]
MNLVKPVLCWIFILCFWRETEGTKISMPNRTRVALAGETLDFNLSVTIPANHTEGNLECCKTQSKETVWKMELERTLSEVTKSVVARIKMHNSSCSGDYYFRYATQEVHWVVLVMDKGYQEPGDVLENDTIILMIFSGILLFFSVPGSLYILKSYKEQPLSGEERNKVVEKRPEESEDDVGVEEDAASASLYTALQHRPGSIYDILNPETMRQMENNQKSGKKYWKAQEDEVFDTVYENF